MKKGYIIGLILLPVIVLFTMWYVNKQLNEKQYAEDLAARFDDAMNASYPMLAVTNAAIYWRADMWEKNATDAYKYYPRDYQEAFQQMNIQTFNTERGIAVTRDILNYNFFIGSGAYGVLERGGDLRKEEVKAFRKLFYAYKHPDNPLEMEYEELINEIHEAKKALSESSEMLSKYKNESSNIDSWRYFEPIKYKDIHKRYNSRKNWPFNFIMNK